MGMNLQLRTRQAFFWLVIFLVAFILVRPAETAGAEASSGAEVKKFHLYATDGYLTLPDGNQVYVWGYSLTNEQGTASYPAPTLEVNEGDAVEVTLTNIGPKKKGIKRVAHTIHWHGLDTDQQNDGVPHTSPAIQVGDSFTYHFTASHAGTYFYHCHVDTVEHLQMGMDGAFVVKAKNGANQAWTGGPAYDKEYVFVLNEIDPVWHKAVEEGTPYDRTSFHPTYWTINGKAYPDTENDPSTMIAGTVGQTVLIRLINSGYQPHSFHMHGHHFQVVASDGRPLPQPQTKDTILIGPGERYDLLVTFDQSGMFPFHSHNIIDNTNNGVYPGGLHTMIDIAEPSKEGAQKSIRFQAGRKTAVVDGETVTLKSPPVVLQGYTYVPFRFIGEQLNADVKLVGKQSILYTARTTSLQLWLDSKQAKADGKAVNIAAPARLVKGILMVPVRLVADQLGARTSVDKATREVVVTAAVPESAMPADPGEDARAGHDHPMPTGDGNAAPGGQPAGGDPLTVTIRQSAFVPQKLTIKKGQTVTWVNQDGQIHTVMDLDDAFASKNLNTGDVFRFEFKDTGTYTYYCSTHPSMQGEITVSD
jgi:plastocyanin